MVSLLPIDESEAADVCTPAAGDSLPVDEAVALAGRLKALAEPTRLRLLTVIAAHEGREACVCDLTEPVNLTQPTVSHHLKILVDAGFLTRHRRGAWAFYALVPGAVDALTGVLRTTVDVRAS
ncbi:MAG: metalloregulator ArsR/SmtB family transcription factor [Aeromicrobium sp.]